MKDKNGVRKTFLSLTVWIRSAYRRHLAAGTTPQFFNEELNLEVFAELSAELDRCAKLLMDDRLESTMIPIMSRGSRTLQRLLGYANPNYPKGRWHLGSWYDLTAGQVAIPLSPVSIQSAIEQIQEVELEASPSLAWSN